VRLTLRYQACDESACLPPSTVSVEAGDGIATRGTPRLAGPPAVPYTPRP
jgi:hypothetical protein